MNDDDDERYGIGAMLGDFLWVLLIGITVLLVAAVWVAMRLDWSLMSRGL